MKVACLVQKAEWSAFARSVFAIRACALHSVSDSSPIIHHSHKGLAETLGRRPDGLRRKHDQCLVLPRVKDLL
jgi:hypothetical protein